MVYGRRGPGRCRPRQRVGQSYDTEPVKSKMHPPVAAGGTDRRGVAPA